MFGPDAKTLDINTDEGYIAWDYESGAKSKVEGSLERSKMVDSLDPLGGWNFDRSILLQPPNGHEGACMASARESAFKIEPHDQAGYDQYGNAWFGSARNWTEVDRKGNASKHVDHPAYLVPDQTKDRGSMHLRDTNTKMTYKGATAFVSCVWLSDDRAIPIPKRPGKTVNQSDSYKAALVFAGPDILTYGFLPSKNMVYVVSQSGNYLVPFSYGPSS